MTVDYEREERQENNYSIDIWGLHRENEEEWNKPRALVVGGGEEIKEKLKN